MLWCAGKEDRRLPLLCKQCVQNFTSKVSNQKFNFSSFTRLFQSSTQPVFRCVRRANSSKGNGVVLNKFQVKSDKIKTSKISKQEFKRLLGLAKPERWKLGGECLFLSSFFTNYLGNRFCCIFNFILNYLIHQTNWFFPPFHTYSIWNSSQTRLLK